MTCPRCDTAPPWPLLRRFHSTHSKLKTRRLPIPERLAEAEQTYNHVVYHRKVGDRPVDARKYESPDVLVGGEWVRRGLIRVWQEAS